jgi:uncharacterized sulfatase
MRALKWIAAGVILMVAVGWLVFDAVLLRLPGVLDGLRNPTAPNHEVAWETGPAAAAASAQRPPNIIFIVADDLGWNDLTFGGGGVAGGSVVTPHIDSLAADGVRFTNGYSGSGTCAPSRAAIMSGRYPTRFGFEFTPTPNRMAMLVDRYFERPGLLRRPLLIDGAGEALEFEAMGMPASEITIAEVLQSAGYHTVHIGKWHLGNIAGMAPHEQGFDESLSLASGKYLPDNDPDVVNSRQDFDPIDKFLWPTMKYAASFNGSPRFEPRGYLTDYYTEEAVKVIEANRHRPFFLYLAHWAPHTPLQAAKADYDALAHISDHRLRVYAAMIRALDRGVGQVLEALRANGLEENTLVLFTSDNGGANYIGLPHVNHPFRGWKISFFEGGIHVPFFMKWPARIAPGHVHEEPVHHVDMFTTAAAAAAAPLPKDRVIDGVNLLARVEGSGEVPQRPLFWRSGHYQVVLAEGWKLQVAARPQKTWLFHLRDDPTEQRNVAAGHPDKVRTLKELLARHNAEQAAPLWPSLVEMPISIDKTLIEAESPEDDYVYWPN